MTHSLSRYPAGVAWAQRALVFAVIGKKDTHHCAEAAGRPPVQD